MTIHLHIEQLVVDGLSLGAHDGAELQAALSAHLTGLLYAQGTPALASKSASMRSLSCPWFETPLQANCGELGLRIAESVHAGLAAVGPSERE